MLSAEIDLMPNERIILASNPHWWYFWKQVAAGAIVVVLLLVLWWTDVSWLEKVIRWVTLVAFIVLVLNTLYEFAKWKTTRFAITDQRVAYQSGLIQRRGVSIPLNRINNVNFHQTAIARILNNGVVVIESAGDLGESVFQNIPDPQHVRTLIFTEVDADEERDSQRDAAALAEAMRQHMTDSAGSGSPSPSERLAQLDEMRANGQLSEEEYAAKRRQILDAL